jgi:hypothetical protein
VVEEDHYNKEVDMTHPRENIPTSKEEGIHLKTDTHNKFKHNLKDEAKETTYKQPQTTQTLNQLTNGVLNSKEQNTTQLNVGPRRTVLTQLKANSNTSKNNT